MSAMNVDIGPIQSTSCLSNVSIPNPFGSNDYQTQTYAQLEVIALNWASQKESEIQKNALAFVAQNHTIVEQRAAEWKARELAQYERQALAWRTREEEEVKNRLEARLAELKQHAESEHARRMAQVTAEHARVNRDERARTAEARRSSQARAVEMARLRKEEEKLRGIIKTQEEAAKQGAAEESTQVQSLKKSLAEKDAKLQEKCSSNTKLQQKLASSQTEVMCGLVWGSRKNVEIASLKQDKGNLILQGQSVIAAKDATIKDLQNQLATVSQSLQKANAENGKLDLIAKDLNTQVEKLKVEGSKTEDKLAAVVSQNPQRRSKMSKVQSKVQRHFAKSKFSNGAADIADALSSFKIETSSRSGSTSTAKGQAAGAVKLGRTSKGRVGKAQSGPSIRPRRRPTEDTDSESDG